MKNCAQKIVIAFILMIAAPQSFAWEIFGNLIFIGHIQARAITRMEDPNNDVNVSLTDAFIFEEGQLVGEDDDICVYATLCASRAKDWSVTDSCEYCGRGSAAEGLTTLLGIPIPFTTREWGGGGPGEVPVCEICNCPGGGRQ